MTHEQELEQTIARLHAMNANTAKQEVDGLKAQIAGELKAEYRDAHDLDGLPVEDKLECLEAILDMVWYKLAHLGIHPGKA